MTDTHKLGIIGLGYVGLPLAVAFGKNRQVLGYDINISRVNELKKGFDCTNEVEPADLMDSKGLQLTTDESDLKEMTIFIVTVPTPIDHFKKPDLKPLLQATATLGKYLKKGDIVIYESTVYPGCTEEDCVPILEEISGLKFNSDFYCGYSPERINPGDKINTLTKIKKVTSGSTPEIAEVIDHLYQLIITAGTHKAPSIKVAEAAKAIENAQRDLNISFVNELALIFDKMNVDTHDVIEAAGSKWNFLKFKPGLVGGHCIGVDPYYLAHKAKDLGYYPQVILSGRRVNDSMGVFIASKIVKLMIAKDIKVKGAQVLILGITFKENCPDIRNTKIIDVYKELLAFGTHVTIFDPLADRAQVYDRYGINLINAIISYKEYSAVVLAVAHNVFLELDFKAFKKHGTIIYDTKNFIERSLVDGRL